MGGRAVGLFARRRTGTERQGTMLGLLTFGGDWGAWAGADPGILEGGGGGGGGEDLGSQKRQVRRNFETGKQKKNSEA